MTTPWDKIDGLLDGKEYKRWLLTNMSKDYFNQLEEAQRRGFRSSFEALPQHKDGDDVNVDDATEDSPHEAKRAKTLTDGAVFSYHPPDPRDEGLIFGRNDAKNKVISYLKGCVSKDPQVYDKRSSKYRMLGTSGVKGIGKTELEVQICSTWSHEALTNAKAIYATYSGGGQSGPYCMNPKTGLEADSLGHLLLVTCGVDKEMAIHVNIDGAIDFIRNGMNCGENDTLVICVDEVIELDAGRDGDEVAIRTMSECMKVQDRYSGKVIFIFTSILDSVYTKLKSKSGRAIQPVPLNMIPLSDVFNRIITDALRALATESPAVYQLILSCAGHPRATVDGLNNETAGWSSTADVTTARLITARTNIVETCKFDFSYINEEILGQWFGVTPVSDELREKLLSNGILHSFDSRDGSPVEFLFPLLLHQWAVKSKRNHNQSTYGHHLMHLFDADLILDEDTEKFMENVMYHYEALLRKSTDGKHFDLKDFYRSQNIGVTLGQVSATVPDTASNLVVYVDNFEDSDGILSLLRQGYIVVSRKKSEVGVEYLSSFKKEDSELLVACVQCKFVHTSVKWKEIKAKMAKAVEWLERKKICHFPVVYTTADLKSMKGTTSEDGVYFTETDIFEFTSRIGILRLHTQKLGSALFEKYPFLRGTMDDGH